MSSVVSARFILPQELKRFRRIVEPSSGTLFSRWLESALDVTVQVRPCRSTGLYSIRRFEKVFIGENDEIALDAVDILRRLCPGLDYSVGTVSA